MIEYTVKVTDKKTEWYFEGERHRLDGPAVEWSNGHKAWCVEGELHRLDGPAVECANGYKEWWVEGKELSEDEFCRLGNVKELSVKEIEKLLGYPVKVVKE